jgi:hypothetical protein
MMGTEMVPETSVICNQLTLLRAREDFINFSGRESFRSLLKLIKIYAFSIDTPCFRYF